MAIVINQRRSQVLYNSNCWVTAKAIAKTMGWTMTLFITMKMNMSFVISKQTSKYHHPLFHENESRQFVMTFFLLQVLSSVTTRSQLSWLLSGGEPCQPHHLLIHLPFRPPYLSAQVHQGDVPAWRVHAVKPRRPGHHQHLQTAAGGQVCDMHVIPIKMTMIVNDVVHHHDLHGARSKKREELESPSYTTSIPSSLAA